MSIPPARTRPFGRAVLFALCAIALTGCVDVDLGRGPPPSLLLDSPPPVTLIPTHIVIRNGAGEVLVNQDLSAPYQVSANPPLEKLDGRLVVETSWDNGTTSRREVTHTPGVRVSLVQSGGGYTVVETKPAAGGDGGGAE